MLNKSQEALISMGNAIMTADGTSYYYLPFWFIKRPEDDLYDVMSPDELPEEVKKRILSALSVKE